MFYKLLATIRQIKFVSSLALPSRWRLLCMAHRAPNKKTTPKSYGNLCQTEFNLFTGGFQASVFLAPSSSQSSCDTQHCVFKHFFKAPYLSRRRRIELGIIYGSRHEPAKPLSRVNRGDTLFSPTSLATVSERSTNGSQPEENFDFFIIFLLLSSPQQRAR